MTLLKRCGIFLFHGFPVAIKYRRVYSYRCFNKAKVFISKCYFDVDGDIDKAGTFINELGFDTSTRFSVGEDLGRNWTIRQILHLLSVI